MALPASTASLRAHASQFRRLLFPDLCLSCSAHVSRQGVVCPPCWGRLQFIEKPYCAVSGMPFAHDFGGDLTSAEVLASPPAYDIARAATVHAGVAQTLVTRLKYGDRTDLAPWMAQWMARAGAQLLADCDIVVPVPLHPLRFWTRRYNQSAELGRALCQQTGLHFAPEALHRKKATKRQVGLKAGQRHRNVQGAFLVPEEHKITVAGRRVLLIDDVLTTGATVESAARALRRAKPAQINVLTFSRVVPWMD